jgi:hypothetical protein
VPLLMQFGETDTFFDADEARKVAEQIKVTLSMPALATCMQRWASGRQIDRQHQSIPPGCHV